MYQPQNQQLHLRHLVQSQLLQHHQLQQAQRALSQIILVRQKLQMRLVYVVVEVSHRSNTFSINCNTCVRWCTKTLIILTKKNAQDYVQISYEVDKANNVLHWTVLDNPGRKANAASGYVYFTIPKDSVGAPTNWQVVQTDKMEKVVNTRNYWKDNDGSYLMGQNGRMDTYTGSENDSTFDPTLQRYKNPAIQRK